MVSMAKKLALLTKPPRKLVPMISIKVEDLGLSKVDLDLAIDEGREALKNKFPFNQKFLAVIAPKVRGGKQIGSPKPMTCHGFSTNEERARLKLTTIRDNANCSCPLLDLPRLSLAENPLPSKKDILILSVIKLQHLLCFMIVL